MAGEYDDLLSSLDSLKTDTRTKALRKSLRVMGQRMKAAIVERAPVQVENVHGVLKAGELAADFRVSVHVATDENAAGEGDTVTIGPSRRTVDIAIDVETGHSNRPRSQSSSRKRNDRTQAHPFVRPAFDATEQECAALFQETMAEEVRKRMNA